MDVQKEIEKLRRELEYHSKLYYVLDAPVISDYEYDMLGVEEDELCARRGKRGQQAYQGPNLGHSGNRRSGIAADGRVIN